MKPQVETFADLDLDLVEILRGAGSRLARDRDARGAARLEAGVLLLLGAGSTGFWVMTLA